MSRSHFNLFLSLSLYIYISPCFTVSQQPTPDSIRADAVSMAATIINDFGVEKLVIHGESIGGVAASGAGRALTNIRSTQSKVKLLICDRTFCNLQATAQRLVGGWAGPAISALVPFWNTDVTGNFVKADCPKIAATDCADNMIMDACSLKAGVAIWKEVRQEAGTNGVAWKVEPPLEYRMADWENVGVRGEFEKLTIFVSRQDRSRQTRRTGKGARTYPPIVMCIDKIHLFPPPPPPPSPPPPLLSGFLSVCACVRTCVFLYYHVSCPISIRIPLRPINNDAVATARVAN